MAIASLSEISVHDDTFLLYLTKLIKDGMVKKKSSLSVREMTAIYLRLKEAGVPKDWKDASVDKVVTPSQGKNYD